MQLGVVLDTNVMLRGLISGGSASSLVIEAAESRRFVTLLSRAVLAEYVAVLTSPHLLDRFPSLSSERVDVVLTRLRFVGEFVRRVRSRFSLPRDPRDEKFIELAIDGQATILLTHDADLLSLVEAHSDAAKRLRQRLPKLQILTPARFLENYGPMLGIGHREWVE